MSTVIKRYYSDKCAILELQRETPGAIATYRIIPQHGRWQLLLTLDSLREIEGEMVGEFDGEAIFLRSRPRPPSPPHSHRFAVWQIKISSKADCLDCWDINLEGGIGHSSASMSILPTRIFRSFATSFLKQEATLNTSWVESLEKAVAGYVPNKKIIAKKIFISSDTKN